MQNDFPAAALARLAARLERCDAKWVVGGSTGLCLRGASLDRAPRDLDIYIDKPSVPIMHARLFEHKLDGPEENETEHYRSILSHYTIGDTVVELVGDFRVNALQSSYLTEVDELLYPNGDIVDVAGHPIRLVPLGHELLFNLLRERKDRAAVAGQLMAREPQRHMPILHMLLERNRISAEVTRQALSLAEGISADIVVPSQEES